MRLGKPLEHLQAALRATQSAGPSGEQITSIGRQLAYAGYLTYDALIWASSVKFLDLTKEKKDSYGKISNRFWLAGIVFNLVHALLKAGRLADEVKALRSPAGAEKVGDDAERNAKYHALQASRAAVRHQFIIDALDVWLPATNLGFVNFNDGVLGFTGFVSPFTLGTSAYPFLAAHSHPSWRCGHSGAQQVRGSNQKPREYYYAPRSTYEHERWFAVRACIYRRLKLNVWDPCNVTVFVPRNTALQTATQAHYAHETSWELREHCTFLGASSCLSLRYSLRTVSIASGPVLETQKVR